MQNLSPYIAYLLISHDCVILPGIGAFVAYDTKAGETEESGCVLPPVRLIGFNPGLKHNDGLLSGLVMRSLGVSYEEAAIIVTRFCEGIRSAVQQEGEYNLSMVGMFRLSDLGHVLFTPAWDSVANACNYGLDPVRLPALDRRMAPVREKEHSEDVVHSLGERWTHAVRVIAASAAVFLFFATPIGRDNDVHEAGLFVTGNMSEYVPTLSVSAIPLDIYQPPVVRPLPEISPVEQVVVEYNNARQKHYIIVGSFPSRATAKAKLPAMTFKSRYTPAILNKDGRYRVYIRSFQDKSSAERFLSSFRSTYPKYSDAWIYTDRN